MLITNVKISYDKQNNLGITTLPIIFLMKVLVRRCIYMSTKIPGGSTKRLQSDNAGMWMNHLHKGSSLQSLKQSLFTDTFSTIFVRLEVSLPNMFFLIVTCNLKMIKLPNCPYFFFNFMLNKNLIHKHCSYNL